MHNQNEIHQTLQRKLCHNVNVDTIQLMIDFQPLYKPTLPAPQPPPPKKRWLNSILKFYFTGENREEG